LLANKRKNPKSALKDLAQAKTKHEKLLNLAKSITIKILEVTKKTLKLDFDKLKRQYETLGKLHSNFVERNSELNATHVVVLNVKAELLSLLKAQAREVKHLTKLVNNQLEKKLKHKIDIQARDACEGKAACFGGNL
jgi:hypothetical protein